MNTNKKINTEKLFYKLILQFSTFTGGTNSLLDPHLKKITQLLKDNEKNQKLYPELIELSNTLAYISKSGTLVNDTIDSESHLQQKYFITRLEKLLDETDIPFEFQKQFDDLKQQSKAKLDSKEYKQLVDSALSLLHDIKGKNLKDKNIIKEFLTDVSSQLSTLEEHALHVSNSNEESILTRDDISNAIEIQVDNIKKSSAEAKELSPLQLTINQHLQALSYQFHKYKEIEDNRQLKTQKQLRLMSQNLQDMETEAESLRNNLKNAHNKALRDSLTGLPNRLAYDERIMLEYDRWLRYKVPLTLIIWDIDLFKLINDNFGHKAGDRTLALVAQLILSNCRKTDFVARFGGEEFVMILPNTNSKQALELAEHIRSIIANSGFNHNGKSITLTISCGISEFLEDEQPETVFERADQALYLSKDQGRNKCSIITKQPPA